MKIVHIYDFICPAKDSMGSERVMEFLIDGQKELGLDVKHIRKYEDIKEEPDIIHFWTPPDMWAADAVSEGRSQFKTHPELYAKFICGTHGWDFHGENYDRMTKDKRIVYLSKVHRKYHNPSETNPIVCNFVNSKRYENNTGKTGDYYLMMVGLSWWDSKSIPDVLNIAASLGIKLVICGGGEEIYVNRVKEYAAKNKNISYRGWVNGKEKNDLIKNSKATLILPKFDANSILLWESLICGSPVVTWSQKAFPLTPFEEFLNNKVACFCDDLNMLKRTLVSGAVEKIERKDCVDFVMKEHTHLDGAKQYHSVYQQILGGK